MKNILLIIDMQKGFISGETNFRALKQIEELLNANLFDCVIASRYENQASNPIVHLMGWDKLMTEEEQRIDERILPCVDKTVKKKRYSAVSDELIEILKSANDDEIPEAVFIVGVDTECCVLATAVELFEIGIRPIVLTSYCGSSGGKAYHEAGVLSLHHLIGQNNIFDMVLHSKKDIEEILSICKINIEGDVSDETPLEEQLVEKLIKNKMHITFAESCTAGLCASKLVNVPNASKVFDVGFVTYSNRCKIDILHVSEDTVKNEGVVSEKVAFEMALGAARNAGSQVGVGISGIAGPGGATATKKVGMVCFGFVIGDEHFTFTKQFGNIGRQNVRERSVKFVFEKLNELIP